MVAALDRLIPRRSPAEHARRRAARLADRRLFSVPERTRRIVGRIAQVASVAQVTGVVPATLCLAIPSKTTTRHENPVQPARPMPCSATQC
jgi:hypothetical protein